MGAIVDILLLDHDNIDLLKKEYPGGVLTCLTKDSHRIREFRLIVPEVEQYDDSYYYFLYDNGIAIGSRNFRARFEYDEYFRERIRARANAAALAAGNEETEGNGT